MVVPIYSVDSGPTSPSTDASARLNLFGTSDTPDLNGDGPGHSPGPGPSQTPEIDPQILEALKSKDRLYVLKLGELMEGLINDRR